MSELLDIDIDIDLIIWGRRYQDHGHPFSPKHQNTHWEKSLTITIVQRTCCVLGKGEYLLAMKSQATLPVIKASRTTPAEEH